MIKSYVSDIGGSTRFIDGCEHGVGRQKYRGKETGNHKWTGKQWLNVSRVWIEQCVECNAVRFWRGNNTVHIGSKLPPNSWDNNTAFVEGNIHVILQDQAIPKIGVRSLYNWKQRIAERWWLQYPEFESVNWLKSVLQEAEIPLEGYIDE